MKKFLFALGLMLMAALAVPAIAACCQGDCEDNSETQTSACGNGSSCNEKTINDSKTCEGSDFWDDNCCPGQDVNVGGPRYTPITYPDKEEFQSGAYNCQVTVNGQLVWKLFSTEVNSTCSWVNGHQCNCGNPVYGAGVGNATKCGYPA